MCRLTFRVSPKHLPVGITKNANPIANFECYQQWAAKWLAVTNEHPKLSDLQNALNQVMDEHNQVEKERA
ncbi:MAG: hypothetical protein ACI9DO_003404 [Reinekea sp.]|jgi:hypothetical protein